MTDDVSDESTERKRNFTAERRKVLRDTCSDHRVTAYQYRLLSAIANRIDVSGDPEKKLPATGKTRAVSHTTLANESCGKNRHSSIAGCKALKQLGLIDWYSTAKGNVFWLCLPTKVHHDEKTSEPALTPVVNGHSLHVQTLSPEIEIEIESLERVRADARPRPRRPKPFHLWGGPTRHDLALVRAKGYGDQRIRDVHEHLRRWAAGKNVHLSNSKWSDVWLGSFDRQDAYDAAEAAYHAEVEKIINGET